MGVSAVGARKDIRYLTTRKRVAPAFVGFLSAFLFLALVVCAIIAIFVRGTALIVVGSIFASCLSLMILFKLLFVWEGVPCLYRIGKKWYYGYHGVVNALGNNEVEVELVSVQNIRQTKSKLIITGEFIEKQPLQKPKTHKKYVIHQFSDDDVQFLQQVISNLTD